MMHFKTPGATQVGPPPQLRGSPLPAPHQQLSERQCKQPLGAPSMQSHIRPPLAPAGRWCAAPSWPQTPQLPSSWPLPHLLHLQPVGAQPQLGSHPSPLSCTPCEQAPHFGGLQNHQLCSCTRDLQITCDTHQKGRPPGVAPPGMCAGRHQQSCAV